MSLNNQKNQRADRLAKRRKTNTILNSLIGIVIVLIIIVSYRIFFAAEEPPTTDNGVSEEVNKNKDKENSVGIKDSNQENTDKKNVDKKDDKQDQSSDKEENKEDDTVDKDEASDGELIVENSDEENVEEIIRNPKWEAVGTEQTNGHQYSASKGTVDWKEKERALSYATDIPVDNMVIWWLERGPGGDSQAIGTISPKDAQSNVYRVHLEWEDAKGWKPTIVKKLIKNDKR